jgi:hypothetical protein
MSREKSILSHTSHKDPEDVLCSLSDVCELASLAPDASNKGKLEQLYGLPSDTEVALVNGVVAEIRRTRFHVLLEEENELYGPALNCSLVRAMEWVQFKLTDLASYPKVEEYRRTKRRTDTRERRRHSALRLEHIPNPVFIQTPTLADVLTFEGHPDGRLCRHREDGPVNRGKLLIARFVELLDGAELARFRRCAHLKCGKVFYARRLDQLCCSPVCNNARWQRNWYKKHGKSVSEYRHDRYAERQREKLGRKVKVDRRARKDV